MQDGGVVLHVIHPTAAVRARVVAAAPEWASATSAPDDTDLLARPATSDLLVVALDPARTSPSRLEEGRVDGRVDGCRIHVLSISDLQLDVPDPAVDSWLPLRRLTASSLARHLHGLVSDGESYWPGPW